MMMNERLTPAQLHHPGDDDDQQGEELGPGEDVLHSRGPLHVPAVHEREHHWGGERKT